MGYKNFQSFGEFDSLEAVQRYVDTTFKQNERFEQSNLEEYLNNSTIKAAGNGTSWRFATFFENDVMYSLGIRKV